MEADAIKFIDRNGEDLFAVVPTADSLSVGRKGEEEESNEGEKGK